MSTLFPASVCKMIITLPISTVELEIIIVYTIDLCIMHCSRFASRLDFHRDAYNFICTGCLSCCILINNSYFYIWSYSVFTKQHTITSLGNLKSLFCFYKSITYCFANPKDYSQPAMPKSAVVHSR